MLPNLSLQLTSGLLSSQVKMWITKNVNSSLSTKTKNSSLLAVNVKKMYLNNIYGRGLNSITGCMNVWWRLLCSVTQFSKGIFVRITNNIEKAPFGLERRQCGKLERIWLTLVYILPLPVILWVILSDS